MYRPLTIVALAASGLFAATTTATAETITVCANGCDYTSINDAIDASSDGDVIQLAAETYFEGEQIDTDGKVVFELRDLSSPSDSDRLPNGNTIVAENTRVREFDRHGNQIWEKAMTWAVEVNRY